MEILDFMFYHRDISIKIDFSTVFETPIITMQDIDTHRWCSRILSKEDRANIILILCNLYDKLNK